MSWFEICMVVLGLLAAALGGHATGFHRGRRYERKVRYRTYKQQLELFKEHQRKNPQTKAGTSLHERGRAFDTYKENP